MPIDLDDNVLSQRDYYARGGLTRRYWDLKDARVIELVGNEPFERLLDAGCGEGIMLEKLQKTFPDKNLTGIDGHPMNIAICARHQLNAIEAKLEAIPLETGSICVALLLDVLEHLPDPESVLREIYRVLKPGGRLICKVPNDYAFLTARLAAFKWKEAFADYGHLRKYRPASLASQLRCVGFEVEKLSSVPLPLWAISLHLIAVARKPALEAG